MKFTAPNKSEFDDVANWLKSNPEIPENILSALLKILAVYSSMMKGMDKAKNTLQTLRQAMGIMPKSEKGSQLAAEGSLEVTSESLAKIEELKRKRSVAENDRRRYDQQLKDLQPKYICAEQLEFDFGAPDEPMFSFPTSEKETKKKQQVVERMSEFGKTRGLQTTYDKTKRMDLRVVVSEIDYQVETVFDPMTGKRVRASMLEEGPPGFQVTWGAVSNLIKMHVGFAIPINRISLMIGQPEFSTSKICRILGYSAKELVAIYLTMAEQLSDVKLLSGDDTSTKVLDKSTPEDEDHLVNQIDEHFGWAAPKADGSGLKKAINVSLLIGRTSPDPRSTIRFYRTHLGSVGNVLTKLLEWRHPKSGELLFQGDLSSTNLPLEELQKKFNLIVAGCGAHARRPFWRHREDDPSLCFFLLRAFLQLAQLEKRIDAKGRTRANILKYRNRYGRWIWNAIKTRCESVIVGKRLGKYVFRPDSIHNAWPKGTDLHRACAYVFNHFEELTLYLTNPHLAYTNNHSERALRIEKCMLSGSKFRNNRNGRAILDILRTFNATTCAAGLDIGVYLKYIAENRSKVQEAPELFTPYQVALAIQKNA